MPSAGQAAKSASSRWQSNVTGSSAAYLKTAVVRLLRLSGRAVITAAGALVSTVSAREAAGETLPAASAAVTSKVCGPSGATTGIVQVASAALARPASAPFSLTTIVAPGSAVPVSVTAFTNASPAGAVITGAGGAVVSTTKLREARSTTAAPRSDSTVKVCAPSLSAVVGANGELHGAASSPST